MLEKAKSGILETIWGVLQLVLVCVKKRNENPILMNDKRRNFVSR